MPTLPLNAAEPVTAILGVMLYPADEDVAARDRWEARTLAPFVPQIRAQGGDIPAELVDWILTHCGRYFDQNDLDERRTSGTMTGEVVKVLLWLTAKRPDVASWSKATDWIAAFGPKGFSRSEIYPRRMRFRRVAHLWGAYCISGRRIRDLQTFLGLSEQIRIWGQNWRRNEKKAQPLFGKDMWLPPEGWANPDPYWPEGIKVPHYDLLPLGARTPPWMLPK
jgi:hypothetical protein